MAQIDRELLIRERAYLLWEAAGRPSGRDLDYWLQAEAAIARPAEADPQVPTASPRAANASPSRKPAAAQARSRRRRAE